jgi:hypothetical protein
MPSGSMPTTTDVHYMSYPYQLQLINEIDTNLDPTRIHGFRWYEKVKLLNHNKSNTSVRTKSIRLDLIVFNTSLTQFPFYTPFCTTATTLFIHNISGSNRGLGDMKSQTAQSQQIQHQCKYKSIRLDLIVYNTPSTQFPIYILFYTTATTLSIT